MAAKGISSERGALTDGIKTIDTLVPQRPLAFRVDNHKINLLRQHFVQKSRTTHTIMKVDPDSVSWHTFTTDLYLQNEIHESPSTLNTHHTYDDEGNLETYESIPTTEFAESDRSFEINRINASRIEFLETE